MNSTTIKKPVKISNAKKMNELSKEYFNQELLSKKINSKTVKLLSPLGRKNYTKEVIFAIRHKVIKARKQNKPDMLFSVADIVQQIADKHNTKFITVFNSLHNPKTHFTNYKTTWTITKDTDFFKSIGFKYDQSKLTYGYFIRKNDMNGKLTHHLYTAQKKMIVRKRTMNFITPKIGKAHMLTMPSSYGLCVQSMKKINPMAEFDCIEYILGIAKECLDNMKKLNINIAMFHTDFFKLIEAKHAINEKYDGAFIDLMGSISKSHIKAFRLINNRKMIKRIAITLKKGIRSKACLGKGFHLSRFENNNDKVLAILENNLKNYKHIKSIPYKRDKTACPMMVYWFELKS